MKKSALILAVVATLTLSFAYAETTSQGAKAYDWQNCVDFKKSTCLNGCSQSEDINCSQNCKEMSIDKCKSEGFSPQ